MRTRGDVWEGLTEHDKALADYERALTIDGKDTFALAGRARVWGNTGQNASAVDDYTAAIHISPKAAHLHFGRGFDYFLLNYTGRPRESRVSPKPSASMIKCLISIIIVHSAGAEKREFDKAIADCDEVIRRRPRDAEAYGKRALAWQSTGDLEKAIHDFSEAIRLSPRDPFLLGHRALAWKSRNELEHAIDDYTAAIKIDPTHARHFYLRGLTWLDLGNHDKAIADFTDAIKIDPQNAEAYASRGHALTEREEYEKALGDLDRAIRLHPGDSHAYREPRDQCGTPKTRRCSTKAIADLTPEADSASTPTDADRLRLARLNTWAAEE